MAEIKKLMAYFWYSEAISALYFGTSVTISFNVESPLQKAMGVLLSLL